MLNIKRIGMYLLPILVVTFFIASPAFGDISPEARKKLKKTKGSLQREFSAFDVQKNTISNIEFFTSNYGIFGLDVANNNTGGGYWPRGSKNQYIFGGGTWFATQKPWPNPEKDDDPLTDDEYRRDENGEIMTKNYVIVSYDPNSAESWFVPGRIDVENREGSTKIDFNRVEKFRTYFSTDFNEISGKPIDNSQSELWPIWDTDTSGVLKIDRYFGYYQDDPVAASNLETTKGPAFISGEDIFATYKDTDLSKYSGGYSVRKRDGYPLYIQIESTIYSWGFGQYKDFIFLRWDFINYSDDTLRECWHAPIMDVDIARYPLLSFGAGNDRVQYFDCDTTLGMATQFTNPDAGERGFGFGYLGFDYLESPSVRKYFYPIPGWEEATAVDREGNTYFVDGDTLIDHLGNIVYDEDGEIIFTPDKNSAMVIPVSPRPNDENDNLDPKMEDTPYYFSWYDYKLQDTIRPTKNTYDDSNFPRTEKQFYPVYEQLNLVTFRNWSIEDDKLTDDDRYEYMASGKRDGDTGAGDKRFMMATGPYNMFPKDTSRVVVGIILARTAEGMEATGECSDMSVLESLDKYAQQVYDNSFQAPRPPERTNILDWKPMGNGVMFKWDETAENSLDKNESGLDFLGYKIYRARRPDLDTFATSQTAPSQEYPLGKGPFGWKEIASFEIETPFVKSEHRGKANDDSYPLIDELHVMGYVSIPEDEWEITKIVKEDETLDTLLSDTLEIFSVKIMRMPKGALLQSDDVAYEDLLQFNYRPVIAEIDTNASPWSPYFRELLLDGTTEEEVFNPQDIVANELGEYKLQGVVYDEDMNNKLYDSVLVGKAVLNKSLMDYNPIFFKRERQRVDPVMLNNYLADSSISRNNSNELAIHKTYTVTQIDVSYDTTFVGEEIEDIDTIYTETEKEVEAPDVEIVYILDTKYTDDGVTRIDVLVPRTLESIIKDRAHMSLIQDSLYSWIQQGKVITEFNTEFEDAKTVREEIIPQLMEEATNGRVFIDKGDDNGNGRLDLSDDPAVTEKLLNNVPYYYKVLAYDEGDPSLPTAQKLNFGVFGLPNVVQAYPAAAPVGENASIEVISQTDELMGGVSNVNFFAVDQEKLEQIYGGDTLELTFTPVWMPSQYIPAQDFDDPSAEPPQAVSYSILRRNLKVTNISTGKVLYEQATRFEPLICASDFYLEQLTNNAVTYVKEDWQRTNFDINGDSLTFQHFDNQEIKTRSAHFTSGDFLLSNYCYADGFSQEAKNLFGFEYDYTVAQYGGVFRPDSMYVENRDDSKVLIAPLEPTNGFLRGSEDASDYPEIYNYESTGLQLTPQAPGYVGPLIAPAISGFDNGPGEYRLVFEEGGEEDLTLVVGSDATEETFKVPYLNVRLETLTELTNSAGDEMVFPQLEHQELGWSKGISLEDGEGNSFDLIRDRYYPYPGNLKDDNIDPATFMTKYNIAAYGWVDSRKQESFLGLEKNYTRSLDLKDTETSFAFTGKEGRYYLSSKADSSEDKDGNKLPIDFTHVINIGGVKFVIDYANKGRTEFTTGNVWDRLDFVVSIDTSDQTDELYDTLYVGNTEEIKQIDTTYNTYDVYDTTFNDYKEIGTMSDFKEGDQIRLSVHGGALGMPYYGAKVRAVVRSGAYAQKGGYTDKQMDAISIVPNPYYLSQQNERSPYDSQLYFTRLPNECTIEIYTVAGDLINSLDYKSGTGDYTLFGDENGVSDEDFYLSDEEKMLSDEDRENLIYKYKLSPQNRVGFDVWDLMTSNGLRIDSQSLIAVIKTPDGAQTVKKFSVVVGSYRLISN
jgi:hypothetical protein